MPTTYLITPANALAFHAVEACAGGDPAYRRVLLIGPRGSGKSALLEWGRMRAAERGVAVEISDPLKRLPPEGYGDAHVLASIDAAAPGADLLSAGFAAAGGTLVSVVVEAELSEAVAREAAQGMPIAIDEEALRLLADRLRTPALVRGALHRLQAEAALAGRTSIDALFAIRTLGSFLYPARP
jgi:chromosomal replication initiation ATPase DnaA